MSAGCATPQARLSASTSFRSVTGSAVPVKFSLAGDKGLDVVQIGFPTSEQMYCDTTAPPDDIETTASAGGSTLSYDATSDTYTCVWKHTAHFAFVK